MTDWRRSLGALLIVVAMVLGAFVGLAQAFGAGEVGVSPSTGPQTGGPRLLSAMDRVGNREEVKVDASGKPLPGATAQPLNPKGSDSPVARVAGVDPMGVESQDGSLIAKRLSPSELQDVKQKTAEHMRLHPKNGEITAIPRAEPGTGTRSPKISAGGPYGGPDCFEGSCVIDFTVTVYDPSILFFRWDFNNDGIFDFPVQVGGLMGTWTLDTTVERAYYDNYFGDVTVEGWDGISTKIVINNGNNQAESTSWQWTLGMFGANYRMVGWVFQAKKTVDVTALGYYWYVYQLYATSIWRMNSDGTRTRLGICNPTTDTFSWNWCTLGTAVTLVQGQRYWIAERIETWSVGYNPPLANQYMANFESTYGCFIFGSDPNNCAQSDLFFQWGSFFMPAVDFKWRETLILPDATDASAFLEVHNVAPTVFNIESSPSPGLEGSPTRVSVFFNDPGTDDTWEFRWTFHDGTVSPWMPVTKLSGGAKFLYLHAQTDAMPAVADTLRAACGTFCTKFDVFDFGPLGQNRVPSLEELLPYDVVYVAGRWGPIPSSDGMGDVLADYMDAGGNVIIDHVANFASSIWGIGGRWQSDGYAPVPRGGETFANTRLGTIRVPGHPILDGVGSWTAQFILNINDLNPGAIRVADWASGQIAIATNTNPIVKNGARSVYLDVVPFFSFDGGDKYRVMANAIRWASQQPNPVPKPMPIQTDPFGHVYKDDDPVTTTLQDTFPVSVEVRDDDDGKVEAKSTPLYSQNFEDPTQCTGSWPNPTTFPPDWRADPDGYGWQCGNGYFGNLGSRGPTILWYYNDPNYGTGDGTSDLFTPMFDLSAYTAVQFEYFTDWYGPGFPGPQHGYVDASVDGGASFPIRIKEYHTGNPTQFRGDQSFLVTAVGGSSEVMFRFRYVSNDDVWWILDNIRMTGLVGRIINGHGSTSGEVTVANVPPTAVGGFSTALRNEAQSLKFSGFTIADPALLVPTEWFAYSWNMGDGTPTRWTYKGSMTPPKFKVLIVQSLCLFGGSCSQYNALYNGLIGLDDVGQVDTYNIIQFPPSAPGVSRLLQYDVIIFASYWAYLGYDPWDTARRVTGDQIAQYLDARRGGVLTFMLGLDLDPFYGDIWALAGRYITDGYAPFKRTTYNAVSATLTDIVQPDHDIMAAIHPGKVSTAYHGGKYPVTVGGKNAAAGVNGEILANWDDGSAGVGAKVLNNGMRTTHIAGRLDFMSGADLSMLVRNAVGYAAGGIPTPKITPFTYTYGDNGVYTPRLELIDDDMGYVWDTATNQPRAVLPEAFMAQRSMTVTVDNVDPLIRAKPEAFIAAEVCLRVSGTGGNTVTAEGLVDGLSVGVAVSVTREGGSPNPATEKCSLLKVDVFARHTYEFVLDYSAPMGGSNPTWLVIAPWRQPVNPGHGTVTEKYDQFNGVDTTVTTQLPTLKQDLLESGQGAPVDFVAEACDVGSDDLAFFWQWGTVSGVPYDPNALSSVYTIHVFHNDGTARTNGVLSTPDQLGFSEPYFNQAANTGMSPIGPMNRCYRDNSVHAFDMSQPIYYVTLIVLDDDNGRAYPSHFATSGTDMTFLVLDLR